MHIIEIIEYKQKRGRISKIKKTRKTIISVYFYINKKIVGFIMQILEMTRTTASIYISTPIYIHGCQPSFDGKIELTSI